MEVIRLSEYDPRVMRTCLEALPRQPHVAAYVGRRLQELGASVLVARMVVDTLAKVPAARRTATSEDVERLAVDDDQDALRVVHTSCDGSLKRDLFVELGARLHDHTEEFETPTGGLDHRRPRAIPERCGPIGAVFNCAFAMLCGLEIDPRERVA